jgi:hypothetical protein
VTYNESARPLGDWADHMTANLRGALAYIRTFIGKVLIITELEARKLRHDPARYNRSCGFWSSGRC